MRLQRSTPFASTLLLAFALIVSALVLGAAIKSRHGIDNTICVDGTARSIVHSDYIIWDSAVSYQATTVADAFSQLQNGTSKLNAYLVANGVKRTEIFPLAIKTDVLYANVQKDDNGSDDTVFRTVKGYRLSQTIEVRSDQVQTIETVSRTATELIKQGVSVESDAPQYRITQLAEIKDSLLAEAAKNAYSRARRIASSSGESLGKLQSSNMGLMTVTGAYEDEASGGGEDTASIDKRVTVMVTSSYLIR